MSADKRSPCCRHAARIEQHHNTGAYVHAICWVNSKLCSVKDIDLKKTCVCSKAPTVKMIYFVCSMTRKASWMRGEERWQQDNRMELAFFLESTPQLQFTIQNYFQMFVMIFFLIFFTLVPNTDWRAVTLCHNRLLVVVWKWNYLQPSFHCDFDL